MGRAGIYVIISDTVKQHTDMMSQDRLLYCFLLQAVSYGDTELLKLWEQLRHNSVQYDGYQLKVYSAALHEAAVGWDRMQAQLCFTGS